jgi:hypothetical protein
MHAWVELSVAGERHVLDPTQGFVGRRANMAPGGHVPVVGMPGVLRKLREYTARTGATAINSYCEHVLQVAAVPDERVASR